MRSRDCILPGILLALITRGSKAFRQRPSHNSLLYPTMPQLKSLSTSPSDPVAEVEEPLWEKMELAEELGSVTLTLALSLVV
jgi:hypothetical protein